MTKRAVVVHAGARDNYQLALALNEMNYLDSLVTDFYCPDILVPFLSQLAEKNYKTGLSSKKIKISLGALISKARMYTGNHFSLHQQSDKVLSCNAYTRAKYSKSHLFCYSYYAADAFFKKPAFSGQRKLLFQLHPHPYSVKQMLEEELVNVPLSRASILHENEFRYDANYLKKLASESLMADAIVVASNYTRKTLVDNGVDSKIITVVPYGIDQTMFPQRKSYPANKKLRIIFIGSMVQRKGISYLLDAVRKLGNTSVELVLCGRGFMDQDLLTTYTDFPVLIKRSLSKHELIQELHQSDIFVLPTLSEGFAQVILEAMACGLPVISTENSCAPDLITSGVEGFIVPVKNSEVLAEKLEWCVQHKQQLFSMGDAAAFKASTYTWEKFRKGIVDFYEKATSI